MSKRSVAELEKRLAAVLAEKRELEDAVRRVLHPAHDVAVRGLPTAPCTHCGFALLPNTKLPEQLRSALYSLSTLVRP